MRDTAGPLESWPVADGGDLNALESMRQALMAAAQARATPVLLEVAGVG